MEKSKIWHYPQEVPAIQYVDIYLLDEHNDISRVNYDEVSDPWSSIDKYCPYGEFVAWAYVEDVVNL